MNARSTAAIAAAVMCAAALGEAHAQRLEPRAAIDFVTLSNGGSRCTGRLVFEHAIRGAALCGDLATSGPTIIDNSVLFLDEREREAKRVASEAALEGVAKREAKEERQVAKEEKQAAKEERQVAKEERRNDTPAPAPRIETPPGDRVIERPEEVYEAVVTATPEPATLALVASGMAGLAAYRRRRAKKSEGINN